ncbi:unnamed protein product [Paramecium primaurelia]|uniref:Uncharacterized protein n=1 Tax=Paramecium primaurelia TaxID=5886 RepID=A0A8S1KXP4_PARPR|nr:unnamed protein product [Paramecium primaurelia]
MLLFSKITRLCLIPTYGCKFVLKKDWKLIKDNTNWATYMDDLNINSETFYHSSSKDLLKAVRDNPENEFYAKSIGQLLYHMGKDGVYDEVVIKKIEKCLYKFKGEFPSRLAFGALYGFLSLSIDNQYLHDFFDAEFRMHQKSKRKWFEAIELVEACGKNKNLSRKYLYDLMKSQCHSILVKEYKKSLKYQPAQQFRLLNACISAKYFEPDLFDPLVKDIVRQQKISRLPDLIKLLNILTKLQNEGDFPRSIQTEIDHLINRLKTTPKFSWLYNADERRYRTMEELKAVRENAPQQFIGNHLYQPEMLEQYLKQKALGNDEAVQREKRLIQEKQLDDLLYDEFMLNKVEQQRNREQLKKEQRKGMKDEDGEDEDEEIDKELTEEEKKDLLTDFQKKHFESLDMETVNPEDLPKEWFMDNSQSQDNEFDEMDERIQQAAQEKSQQAKNKEFKKRKGRSGKGDIFDAIE